MMTDKEIKKGLKTCAEVSCEGCPYAKYVNTYRYSCSHKLKLDARNLIQKQEKDIKQLKTECTLLDDELRNARQNTINVLNELKKYITDDADYIYKTECGEYAKVNITLVEKHIDEVIKEQLKCRR